MWEVPQHLTAGRAEGDRGEGGQTLAAVCLCGSVEEYVFGKVNTVTGDTHRSVLYHQLIASFLASLKCSFIGLLPLCHPF